MEKHTTYMRKFNITLLCTVLAVGFGALSARAGYVQDRLDTAQEGDVVTINQGVYVESSGLNFHGKNITLKGEGGGAIIDLGSSYALMYGGGSLDNLTLMSDGSYVVIVYPAYSYSVYSKITNCTITGGGTGTGIYASGGVLYVAYCAIEDVNIGVRTYTCYGADVSNNQIVIPNSTSCGIYFTGGAQNYAYDNEIGSNYYGISGIIGNNAYNSPATVRCYDNDIWGWPTATSGTATFIFQ